jgi:hypothetical protein
MRSDGRTKRTYKRFARLRTRLRTLISPVVSHGHEIVSHHKERARTAFVNEVLRKTFEQESGSNKRVKKIT